MKSRLSRFHVFGGGGAALFAFVASVVACAEEEEGCEATQTCISPSKGGEGGEGNGGTASTGGGSGGNGGNAGRGGNGGTSGTMSGGGGGTSGASGDGGTSGAGGDGGDAGAAGGDNPGGDGGGGGDGPTPDVTPPTVVSVTPANNAPGVRANTDLVITFSEPMSRAATEAAFASADISAVTFSWNASSTVLTVNPSVDLAYASGSNPASVTARLYRATVTAAAEDAAGNELGADFAWSFRTLRRLTGSLATSGYTAYFNPAGALIEFRTCGVNAGEVPAGDGGNSAFHHAYVETNLSSLPPGIVEFEEAVLFAAQSLTQGEPFPSLGALNVEHIRVQPVSQAVPNTPSIRTLQTWAPAESPSNRTANVVAAVTDDYGELSFSQVRFAFAVRTNGDAMDDYVNFDCNGFGVEVRYLVP